MTFVIGMGMADSLPAAHFRPTYKAGTTVNLAANRKARRDDTDGPDM
jgi:hypothetical protein